MSTTTKRLQTVDCERLTALLRDEHEHYRRLLRLARRQNSYMRRQDVVRLDANSVEWGRWVPEANAVRLEREGHVARMAARVGLAIPPGRTADLLDHGAAEWRRETAGLLGGIRRTAVDLARQNAMNRQLAEFCLELAREESEIFKKAVLDDPAGCYSGDARTAQAGPGGVIVRQA